VAGERDGAGSALAAAAAAKATATAQRLALRIDPLTMDSRAPL